jgi:hypothetical protein
VEERRQRRVDVPAPPLVLWPPQSCRPSVLLTWCTGVVVRARSLLSPLGCWLVEFRATSRSDCEHSSTSSRGEERRGAKQLPARDRGSLAILDYCNRHYEMERRLVSPLLRDHSTALVEPCSRHTVVRSVRHTHATRASLTL